MNLANQIPQHNKILAIAERIKNKYPDSFGKCELMAEELYKELKSVGINCYHVIGNFYLDEPISYKYMDHLDINDPDDEYSVEHDWVKVEGKILDISADQFREGVDTNIPDIVFMNHSDPLYIHYEELKYGDTR